MFDDFEKLKEILKKEEALFFREIERMNQLKALTEKRMELLRTVREEEPSSIREAAELVDRDVKNVFDDLCLLDKFDVIDLIRKGKRKKPVIKRKIIVVSLE